jgi:hypothetical protein
MLRSIAAALHEEPSFFSLLKFFITSRPKSRIHDIFTGTVWLWTSSRHLTRFADIYWLNLHEFARIRCERFAVVPSPRPSPTTIDEHVQKSSGYFLHAATIVKFVDQGDSRPSPIERLNLVIGGTQQNEGRLTRGRVAEEFILGRQVRSYYKRGCQMQSVLSSSCVPYYRFGKIHASQPRLLIKEGEKLEYPCITIPALIRA